MKGNQVFTRLSKEHIEIIAKLARDSRMTPSAMLRRLVLERLEQIFSDAGLDAAGEGLELAAGKGEPNEN